MVSPRALPLRARRFGVMLLAVCGLAVTLLWTATHTHANMRVKAEQDSSELLDSLRQYEVVAISSDALHSLHPQSIALDGQPASQRRSVRQFSSSLSLSFHSLKHNTRPTTDAEAPTEQSTQSTMRPMSMTDRDESESEEASSSDSLEGAKLFEHELERMDDLFGPDYSQTAQVWENGVRQRHRETVTPLHEVENCYYRARTFSSEKHLTLSTCKGGFTGFIKTDGVVWLLEPAHLHLPQRDMHRHLQSLSKSPLHTTNGTRFSRYSMETPTAASLHLLFRAEDVVTPEFMCSVGLSKSQREEFARTGVMPRTSGHHSQEAHDEHDGHDHSHASHTMSASKPASSSSAYTSWQAATEHLNRAAAEAEKEESEAASMEDFTRRVMHPTASTSQKYVELLVVNDFARYTLLGSATEQNTAEIVAFIKTTYEATTSFKPLMTVVLIGQITWTFSDPFTVAHGQCSACTTNNGVSVDELLKAWNVWRSNSVNVSPYAPDNGHLYSGFTFEVPTLGYAGVGAMCTNSVSGGIESMLGTTTFYNSIVGAHEMGHNLGMNHDSTDNSCPSSGYIMNAVLASPTPTVFSSCSITYETSFMATSYITCLDNVPTAAYGDAVCGNGFVETGEDCDCGNTASCQATSSLDKCCEASTCKFVTGATCSARDGCCDSCQIVPASSALVCRAAANTCDIPEVCTGSASACPADVGYGTGTSCQAGQYGPGLCYLNQCFSYLQQCRTAGANFAGAPYDTCTQQATLNSGSYCSTLWCSSTPGQCTYFKQSSVIITMSDGVPCPDSDSNLYYQCSGNACVNPEVLNVNYKWNTTGWPICTVCTDYQYQNVTCVDVSTGLTVANGLCTPTSKPSSSQLCINEAAGCSGTTSSNSDVIDLFGYVTFSRKTVIFVTMGLCAAFLIVIGCCYQAVTYVGEHEDMPGPPADTELAKESQLVGLTSTSTTSTSKKKRRKKKKAEPELILEPTIAMTKTIE